MKPDSDEIIDFIDNLANESWLGSVRSRWTKYVFHYTDIRNAVEILKNEKLLCRAELERTGKMLVDNASRTIISTTETDVKNYVRLYFRPKTPTQFNNEGIRSVNEQSLESHCPVPIFFLFDSKTILTKSDCQFAEGNLAKLGIQGFRSTADELASFDFRKIYHQGVFNRTERNAIILHRNAEIVVPDKLDLSALKLIVCRSPAEKETLLYLLPKNVISKWGSKILVDTKADFYNRNWAFVQTAQLNSKIAVFDFSPDTVATQPFVLTAIRRGYEEKILKQNTYRANKQLILEFPRDIWKYEIELRLDDNLAFIGSYDGSDNIPF